MYFSKPPADEGDDYLVDHSIITYLINPEGKFVAYYGQNVTAEQLSEGIGNHIKKYQAEHKA